MRIAVIADIHANILALEAVLGDVSGLGVERVVCLGDLVGYNAEPRECVARVRSSAHTVVAGNHDRDTVGTESQPGTNATARCVQRWTRDRLEPDDLAFLDGLPAIVDDDAAGFVAVHGCWLNGVHTAGYVTGTMLEANLRAIATRNGPRFGLCGHTHMPMVGWLGPGGCEETRGAVAGWPADASAVLVNPGSVGQPRDGDPRAAFAIIDFEARRVELRRAEYDVRRAAKSILDAGLPPALAIRLLEGR